MTTNKNEEDKNNVISTSETRVIDDLNASLSLQSQHVTRTLANARQKALSAEHKRWQLTPRSSFALSLCCLAIIGSLYINTLSSVSTMAPLPIGNLNSTNGISMIPQQDMALLEDYEFLTWLNENAPTQ